MTGSHFLAVPQLPGAFPGNAISQEPFCCSEPQFLLLANYSLYLVTCVLLWRSRVLRPLKLFTVFLHELGHAVAVWLTCGKVQGIEVHADEGGLTHWSHYADHMRWASHLVLPAGYLGSAAWGGVILVCCARPATTHAIAAVLIVFLTIALGYSLVGKSTNRRDWTLTYLCVGMLVVLTGLLFLRLFTGWHIWDLLLSKLLLLVGSMNTVFATYDIWEDCVFRSSDRSDACRYAELLGAPCATGRCVGIAWLVGSFGLALLSMKLALSWAIPGPVVTSLGDLHASSCLFLFFAVVGLSAALADRWPALRAMLAAASGSRSRIRPWASAPSLAHQPLRDVLLADWRDAANKPAEHVGLWPHIAAEKGAEVALRDVKFGDHTEEALFFSDEDEETKLFSDCEGDSE